MVRLFDSNGVLLGGLNAMGGSDLSVTPEASVVATAAPIPVPRTPAAQRYSPGEIVYGLECHYGSFAYDYSSLPNDNTSQQSRRHGCHNPIEKPEQRHYCEACRGNYCSVHAAPANHDCDYVIQPGT